MEAFKRSWEITKLTFDVIKKDKEMLLFPIMAGIFSLLFIVAMVVPTILTSLIGAVGGEVMGTFVYGILFIIYLGLAFIATFFNVCVVYTAKTRFEGKNATFAESIKFAMSKVHLIFLWSLVSATVGLILRMIDSMAERAGKGGQVFFQILSSMLGMAWSIITIFVIPGMVYHDLTPFKAIKKSINTLKKTWGESLIRYFALGMAQFIFILVGILIAIPLFLIMSALGVMGIIVAIILTVIYFLGVILVFQVANTVFNTALYVYADQGKVPSGYSKEVLQKAFRNKKTPMRGFV